jgi:hypothetical protein
MRIPEAKEQQVNIMPRVASADLPSPVITNNGGYEAANQLQQAMNNAADGFVKMYVADQRADAIHAYDDYNKSLRELRDGVFKTNPQTGLSEIDESKLDPQTGLPVGFNQLKGDQINEDNLQAWQDKAASVKAIFEQKIRGFVPDIKDEFTRRSDEQFENYTLAINSHFLKGKYEKASNAADLDVSDIITNEVVGMDETEKFTEIQSRIYKDFYTAVPDDNYAKKKTQEAMEKLIHNQVVRIVQEGTPTSYNDAKRYLNSKGVKSYLSENSLRSEIHALDLEGTKWQMRFPTTTTASIQNYIKKNTTVLTPYEKALFIAEAEKRDASRAGSATDKKMSDWLEMVSRVSNAQPDYFQRPNIFGIYLDDGTVNESSARQFQANFLEFTKSVVGAIHDTPYNLAAVKEKGLEAILPEGQREIYTSGKAGHLMKKAYNSINNMLKKGDLSLLNFTQMGALSTLVGQIEKGNYNLGQLMNERIVLQNKLNEIKEKLGANPDAKDMNEAITYLREYESKFGQITSEFTDTSFIKTKNDIMALVTANMVKSYERDRGLVSRVVGAATGITGWFRTIGDTWNKFDFDDASVNRNNELLSKWNKIAHSNIKNEDGSKSILPEAYKHLYHSMWSMMNGNGLTLYNVRPDGTVDPLTAEGNISFAVDAQKDDLLNEKKTDTVVYKTIDQFIVRLNQKYNTPKYKDFRTLDFDSLATEDVRLFQEMLSRNWLEANGHPNKTFYPEYAMAYENNQVEPMERLSRGFSSLSPAPYFQQQSLERAQKREENAKRLYVAPLDYTDSDLKLKSFTGGITSNKDAATMLEAGFVNAEDMLLQEKISKKNKGIPFERSEIMHNLLNILAPSGANTAFVDPDTGRVTHYWDIQENIRKNYGFKLEESGTDYQKSLAKEVYVESQKLLDNVLSDLVKDNPNTDKETFLLPNTFHYNVSERTLKNIDSYQKLRKKLLEDKRQQYLLVGSLGPTSTKDWAKYNKQEKGAK